MSAFKNLFFSGFCCDVFCFGGIVSIDPLTVGVSLEIKYKHIPLLLLSSSVVACDLKNMCPFISHYAMCLIFISHQTPSLCTFSICRSLKSVTDKNTSNCSFDKNVIQSLRKLQKKTLFLNPSSPESFFKILFFIPQQRKLYENSVNWAGWV